MMIPDGSCHSSMTATAVDLQVDDTVDNAPSVTRFEYWVCKTIAFMKADNCEISVRLVGLEESRSLNQHYRGKDKPTNVLSFPLADTNLPVPLLGDLVICAPIVEREAQQQGKVVEAHWAHMVVHGVLHLLGLDHEQAEEAEYMESIESTIMQNMGYADPYVRN